MRAADIQIVGVPIDDKVVRILLNKDLILRFFESAYEMSQSEDWSESNAQMLVMEMGELYEKLNDSGN